MGKRELLIALAFGLLGGVAWWLTAPPPAEDARPLSLDTVAEIWRNRNPNASGGRASVTSTGTLPAEARLSEVRLANVLAVDITGADRDDIAWTLTVEATGPTDAQARTTAQGITLQYDDMGAVLAMSIQVPSGGARTGTLTLSIPARLGVRIESARRATVAGVARVRLENLVGDVTLRDIDGAVEGGHRSGSLAIDDPGSVTLSLVGSTATIRRAGGPVDLTVRNGATTIESPRGDVVVEGSGHDLFVADPAGRVRASLVGGSIAVERPRAAIDVDARRSRVRLAVDRAVPGTVFLAEGQLTLALTDLETIAFDVAVDDGQIDAAAVGLSPAIHDGRPTLINERGDVPRVAVRAERGSIVIVPLK